MIERITQRSAFRSFGRDALRSKSGPLTVVRGRINSGDRVAVAYAIPKAVGPAVVRNRLRRQLRVAVSEVERRGSLAPGAYLIVVAPGARGAEMSQLRGWLASATDRLPIPIGDSDDRDSSKR